MSLNQYKCDKALPYRAGVGLKSEHYHAILEEKPIDVISTFNIKKLFGSPEYPKFKTLTEMNEFSQNMLHGIIENART